MNRLRALLFLLAAVLLVTAASAGSLTYQGCWTPFPTCNPAYDIYTDSSGRWFNCGACGTTSNPNPNSCQQVGNLNQIGYWCS